MDGQSDPNRGSGPVGTLDASLPTMRLDEAAAEVEAQAQIAPRLLPPGVGEPIPPLPDALLLVEIEAWPPVAHLDPGLTVVLVDPDLDRAIRRGILEGIGQKVRHHLPNALAIRLDPHRLRWQPQHDLPARPGELLLLDHLPHQPAQLTWRSLQGQPVRLVLSHLRQVREQPGEPPGGGLGAFQTLLKRGQLLLQALESEPGLPYFGPQAVEVLLGQLNRAVHARQGRG